MRERFEISITYCKAGSQAIERRQLREVEYFDLALLESGESLGIESVPRWNHAYEYLDCARGELTFTELSVREVVSEHTIFIREEFWANGRHCSIERQDLPERDYPKLILELQTSPRETTVVRFGRDGGSLRPVSHVRLEDQPDGSQIETMELSTRDRR
jgi:hypothetical protein